MHLLTKGEATRSVSEQIADAGDGTVRRLLRGPGGGVEVAAAGESSLVPTELRAAIEALGVLELAGDKRFQKAVDTDRKTIVGGGEQGWESFLGKGLAAAVLDGTEVYYKKPIPDNVARRLPAACGARQGRRPGPDRRSDRGHLGPVAAVRRRVSTPQGQRSGPCDSKTSRGGSASPAIGDRLEEVGYRLDGQVAHLLLDEFQDTSPLQWRVLRPFARRVVARRGPFALLRGRREAGDLRLAGRRGRDLRRLGRRVPPLSTSGGWTRASAPRRW